MNTINDDKKINNTFVNNTLHNQLDFRVKDLEQ